MSLAVALGLLCALALPQGPSADVEREWRIRSWALAPAASRAELEAALVSERWTERAAALEALRRACQAGTAQDRGTLRGGFAARVVELALDSGAPEQAQALAALTECFPDAVDSAWDVVHACAEPTPAVELAMVRWLTRSREGAELWGGIYMFTDELRSGDAVRAGLEGLAARGDLATELALFVRYPRKDDDESWRTFLEDLERLERSRVSDEALRMVTQLEGRPALERVLDEPTRRALEAAVEATRAIVHGEADVEVWVDGWSLEGPAASARRDLNLRGARALHGRARGAELAHALLGRASLGQGGDAWIEGAALAEEPSRLVAWVAADGRLPVARCIELWTALAGLAESWEEPALEPWLAAPAATSDGAELRLAVLDALASSLHASGDPVSGAALAAALGDPGAAGELAFRALATCEAPGPWLEDLARAWGELPAAERAARLRFLPRGRDLAPFRAGLIELGERDPEARGACAELLAGSRGDAAIGAVLERWLSRALMDLEVAPGPSEQRAIALVRAVRALGLEAHAGLLDHVAARTAHRDLPVAKTALGALAARPGTDARLVPWLDESRPARLRVEAALALAARAHPAAPARLEADYAGCDVVLKGRILRALAPSAPFEHEVERPVLRVARDREEPVELRRLAVDALALDRRDGPLFELLASEDEPELRAAVLLALARRPGPAVDEVLAASFAAVDGPAAGDGADELRAAEREVLLRTLAARGARGWSERLRASWLRRPLASAAADLEARFEGRRLPRPEFSFGGELALAESLARRGALAAELERAGALARLDGRLLLAFARAVSEDAPRTARTLLRAARVALEGEADGEDGPRVRLVLRLRLLALARSLEDWPRMAELCDELLADWRALRLPEAPFLEAFGEHDPAAGVDPIARLASAALQARARAALARGDLEGASALARGARAQLGASAVAAREQAELEARLRAR